MDNPALDEFCGSPFWNATLTWETSEPDLTRCFERTVLVWVPCIFLWLCSPLELYYIKTSKNKDIPWNWLNLLKLLVTLCLCVISLSDLIIGVKNGSEEDPTHGVDLYTPLLMLISYALSAALLYYARKHGLQCSGVQFFFWFFSALCGVAEFQSHIREAQRNGVPEYYYYYVSYLIYYPLVVLMFLLNCFADQRPKITKYARSQNQSPEEEASFLSFLTFAWFDSMMVKGFRKPLVITDLWDLRIQDRADEVVPQFEKNWEKAIAKRNSAQAVEQTEAKFRYHSGEVDFTRQTKKKIVHVFPVIIKTFGLAFLFGASLKIVQDVLIFVNPQILKSLISFASSDEPLWKGILYATIMIVAASLQTMFQVQHFNRVTIVGMHIRTSVVSAIYRKALRISNNARKERTQGEIVNLMAVDAQKFLEMANFVNLLWSAPIQICIAVYFLWQELGPSILAGLAVMILLIPVNGYIVRLTKVLQVKQMRYKDERVKIMNEVLSGIRVLKLYAWEPSFENKVQSIRKREIKVLRQAAYLHAATSLIWNCAPFMVSLVTFATYVLVDEKNVLDAAKAFASISLFNILRGPLSMLPMVFNNIVQTYVSIKRIDRFMNSEELDPNNVLHDPSEIDPVIIEKGMFSWGEEPILKNINLRVEKGRLAAIVGTVGSGKSSLISACLGEMDKMSGRVNTVGSIAYVPQQAWIQNATLRDNITFGKELDKILYEKVIHACALKADLDMLPAGDQTEIGEKGINLSGGQKQRISLARAVYTNADIYLLDDPLSAVDAHVGKHIFENVIGPKGMLRNKTRVLVTHGVTYLPQTDQISVLKDGEISECGSYQELLNKKGAFAEFLVQHIREQVEDTEELDELKKQMAGTPIIEKIADEIFRKQSRVSESLSETGSNSMLNGLKRQKSTESVRSRKSKGGSVENLKRPPRRGEKLIEIEKAETGNVRMDVYMHYLKSIGYLIIIATIFLNAAFQGFGVGSNFWLGIWADDTTLVVNGTVNTGKRDMYLGIYAVLGLGQGLSTMFSNLIYAKGTMRAAEMLHNLVLHNVLRLPMAFFDVTPSGRILGRFSSDIIGVDLRLPMNFNTIFMNSLRVLSTLVVISYTSPLFIAIIVPISIFYVFIQRFYVATSRQIRRLQSVTNSPVYSHFGESINGAHVIRAYKKEDTFIGQSESKVDLNQVCFYASNISNRWLAVRLEMIANSIIFFAGLFAVLGRETMPPSLVGLSITYSMQITQTLNFLVRMTSDVETNIVAVERLKEYAEVPQEAPWHIPNKAPPSEWPTKGVVSFKDYSVRYRPGLDLVLKQINFTVNSGEKVGIVGRTGAGKSSLTLALFRIIEAAGGKIMIDNLEVATMGLHNLRSRLTIIPQDPVLFSGSLRMNLDPFDAHSDEDLWKCLQLAHLKDFVNTLPLGLQHQVSEGGENLSVGQRQLICLARALLRNTKILILDEATAAVDLETDDLIQRTIRTEFKDCTVITIAHRINTIMDSERVIVLDKGMIVEFDTPMNLLNNPNSIFYVMSKDAGLA